MSEEAWRKKVPGNSTGGIANELRTYTGEALEIVGQAQVNVTYQDQTIKLPIQVIRGGGPSLLGRNWLKNIKLNWGSIKKISCDLDNVLTRHQAAFKDELSTLQGVKAKLFVKPNSKPKFFKPRPGPHALKAAIEQESDCLESMGGIEKVGYLEWAAPIVPVVKPDNSIRVCGYIELPSIPFWTLASTSCQIPKNCFMRTFMPYLVTESLVGHGHKKSYPIAQ